MDTEPKPVVVPAEALSVQLQAAGIVPHNRKRRPPPAPGRLTNASNRRGRREYGTGRRGGENWGGTLVRDTDPSAEQRALGEQLLIRLETQSQLGKVGLY